MEIKYLITVVLAFPVLFLTIMSIVIFFGYGGGMIAGYHFDAKGSAAKKISQLYHASDRLVFALFHYYIFWRHNAEYIGV